MTFDIKAKMAEPQEGDSVTLSAAHGAAAAAPAGATATG